LKYLEESSWDNIQGPEGEAREKVILYTHFTRAWASIALLKWGTRSRKVENEIRNIVNLRITNPDDDDYGGFSASLGEPARTWATMQAIFALRLFFENLSSDLMKILDYIINIRKIKKDAEDEVKERMIRFLGHDSLLFSKKAYLIFSVNAFIIYIFASLLIFLLGTSIVNNYLKIIIALYFSGATMLLYIILISISKRKLRTRVIIFRALSIFVIAFSVISGVLSLV